MENGEVVLSHKSGNKISAVNYHPVSLIVYPDSGPNPYFSRTRVNIPLTARMCANPLDGGGPSQCFSGLHSRPQRVQPLPTNWFGSTRQDGGWHEMAFGRDGCGVIGNWRGRLLVSARRVLLTERQDERKIDGKPKAAVQRAPGHRPRRIPEVGQQRTLSPTAFGRRTPRRKGKYRDAAIYISRNTAAGHTAMPSLR